MTVETKDCKRVYCDGTMLIEEYELPTSEDFGPEYEDWVRKMKEVSCSECNYYDKWTFTESPDESQENQ